MTHSDYWQKLKDGWPVIIPILFLILSFGVRSYSLYQIVIICFSVGFLVYKFTEVNKLVWVVIFSALAIIFNPLVPFYLSPDTWHLIDLGALILLLASLLIKKKSNLPKNPLRQ